MCVFESTCVCVWEYVCVFVSTWGFIDNGIMRHVVVNVNGFAAAAAATAARTMLGPFTILHAAYFHHQIPG